MKRLPKLGSIQGVAAHRIDAGAPKAIAAKVASIAMVAQREIEGPTGVDGDGRPEQQLYVLADAGRCIAMVFIGQTDYVWHLAWNDAKPGGVELRPEHATMRAHPVIARVWVAANYRQRAIAQELVDLAVGHSGLDRQALWWELPFTIGGNSRVRKISPAAFLGSCDPAEMGEILAGKARAEV
ncbi:MULTISPECIES: hypothetical protein [Hydrogenophaga]|uniref:hypothetical protein n=1 Tax=Hydrogenophaga TaxID=47420 RepID=UPI002043960C|nr:MULTISPECIES: hypothetical protein [Hydrogenophaga]MCM3566335.1 hypothetical protein [Hydrogenophaga intermedia]